MKAARLMSRWIILAPMVIGCAGDPTCPQGAYPAVMATGGNQQRKRGKHSVSHRPSRCRIAASASTIDS